MQRTQIDLTREECAALDREARRRGRTRSELIRQAIELVYLKGSDSADAERALLDTSGAWKRRKETGEEYVERMRSGRLSRLHAADR